MIWEQLVKKQTKDYRAFMANYKQSFEQFNSDKSLLLGEHTEGSAPANVRDKIRRDFEAWKLEWGLDGQQFKTMQEAHQKQLDDFLNGRLQ